MSTLIQRCCAAALFSAACLASGPTRRSASAAQLAPRADSVDARRFLHDYYAAYNAQGAERLAAFYADDALFTDPSFGLNLRGKRAIGDLLVRALAKYETLDHEVIQTTQAGNRLVVEGLMVATLRGKPLRVRYVSVFEFAGGRITAQRDLYDLLHYNEQMGISPVRKSTASSEPEAHGVAFAVSVPDVAASIEWYSRTFDLRLMRRSNPSPTTETARLEGHGMIVEVIHDSRAKSLKQIDPRLPGSLYVHGIAKVRLIVEDLSQTLAALAARGVSPSLGPFPRSADSPANAIVRDNQGNFIQLVERSN